MQDVEALSRNSYANYVVQHVLIHGSSVHRSQIVASVRGRLLSLSKHKFASNVVEKCFAHASKQDRDALIDEVLGREGSAQAADSSNSVLIAMVKDQYANYVIQRLIDVLDDEQRHGLVTRIRRYVNSLKKVTAGTRCIDALCSAPALLSICSPHSRCLRPTVADPVRQAHTGED